MLREINMNEKLYNEDSNQMLCDASVTLLTTCKAFVGETTIFQENAIANWLEQFSNVILFGTDEGVVEIAKKYDLIHVPNVDVNADGLPYINSMFDIARKISTTPYLAYINSDILLSKDFSKTVRNCLDKAEDKILVVARRKNIPIVFSILDEKGKCAFEELVEDYAVWDRANAIDLFIFNKDLYSNIPPFIIGRMAWDNWLLWKARDENAQVIDISHDAFLYHPIHGYSSVSTDRNRVAFGADAQQNKKLAGGNGMDLDQAATQYLKDGDLYSVAENGNQVSKICKIDLEKEFLSGLKYLNDGIDTRPVEQTIDCLKTILFRHNQFVPMEKDINRKDFGEIKDIVSGPVIDAAPLLEDWVSRQYIAKIKDALAQGRPIYIWGAGGYGRRLDTCLNRAEIPVAGVLDSDLDLIGSDLGGSKILSYEEILAASKRAKPFVLIASMYFIEIGALLEQYKLKKYVDYIA